MSDPAKNPYAASTTTPGGTFPLRQGPGTIGAAATTGTVITLALIGGVVMITGILAFLILSDPPEDQSLFRFDGDVMIFLGIGYLFFFGAAMVALVMRGVMKGQAAAKLRAADEDLPQPLEANSPLPRSGQAFLGAVATYTLIGQALLEGPAVINAIFMFLDNNFAHAIPIALGIVGIAMQIPTAGRIKTLMENAKL